MSWAVESADIEEGQGKSGNQILIRPGLSQTAYITIKMAFSSAKYDSSNQYRVESLDWVQGLKFLHFSL
jgi:hypothetical protein